MDQGSHTYDIVILDDQGPRVVLEKSYSTRFVKERPEVTLHAINGFDVKAVVLPTGFGTVLKRVEQIKEEDYLEISLKKDEPSNSSLAKVIKLFKEAKIEAYLLPSVKHLNTVPKHRKLNRFDLGTSDKVCSAALGIYTQVTRRRITPQETCFVLAELGSAFNAFVTVENGMIVDGVGGTNCWLGMAARGSVDGEVAAYLGKFSKSDAYKGGALYLFTENAELTPEELGDAARNGSQRAKILADAYIEGVLRDISGSLGATGAKPKDIFLSGRVSGIPYFFNRISNQLERILGIGVSRMENFGSYVKEGAIGAAIIANGLVGGEFREIVESLKIKDASGSVFDDVYLKQD